MEVLSSFNTVITAAAKFGIIGVVLVMWWYDNRQMRRLLRGCAAKGRLVGMDVMEVNPMFDPTERTASLAVRMILDLLGAARLK